MLAAVAKELLQQPPRFFCGNAVDDLWPVVTLGVGKDASAVAHAPHARVVSPLTEAIDSRGGHAGSAHRSSAPQSRAPGSRSEPAVAQAMRMARISAWAVGSLSSRVRLPARARTVPSAPTRTAPTGTSPRRAAARASARAAGICEA